jgi:hypothetical protein
MTGRSRVKWTACVRAARGGVDGDARPGQATSLGVVLGIDSMDRPAHQILAEDACRTSRAIAQGSLCVWRRRFRRRARSRGRTSSPAWTRAATGSSTSSTATPPGTRRYSPPPTSRAGEDDRARRLDPPSFQGHGSSAQGRSVLAGAGPCRRPLHRDPCSGELPPAGDIGADPGRDGHARPPRHLRDVLLFTDDETWRGRA